MYHWVTVRKIARTEGPTYPPFAAQTVDAVVARWIPATAALLACFVTPARADLDARYYESPNYPVGAAQTVDASVRTWMPAADAELQSYRVDARPPLDVRRYDWAPEFISVPPAIDQTIARWTPAFSSELASERVRSRPALDVRQYDWTVDESAWIKSTLPVGGATVAQTAPAWTSQAQSYRTAEAPDLDLFRTTSRPSSFGIPEDWAAWTPTLTHGDRTIGRAALDVRSYEWGQFGWVFAAISTTPPTTAQTWPAVSAGLNPNYRTADRADLDVRAYEWSPAFSWIQPVIDTATARQAGVFGAELASVRTADGLKLDVRSFEWLPAPAWIFTSLPPAVSLAQTWPAVLEGLSPSYRTAARAPLDVRAFDWAPAFSWVQPVVDATVRTWLPVFDAELASTRTPARRQEPIQTEPLPAWLFATLPVAVTQAQLWPAILQGLSPSYRTGDRARLDVRAYDWAPMFSWPARVVDAIVARWSPVFLAELGYRTPGRPLDVRMFPDFPWSPRATVATVVVPTEIITLEASSTAAVTLAAGTGNTTLDADGGGFMLRAT